jgi:hypothetical protein
MPYICPISDAWNGHPLFLRSSARTSFTSYHAVSLGILLSIFQNHIDLKRIPLRTPKSSVHKAPFRT